MKRDSLPEVGAPLAGGFFADLFTVTKDVDGAPVQQTMALIVAPREGGERALALLPADTIQIPLTTYGDSALNLAALLQVGSEAAAWAKALSIGEREDWTLPTAYDMELAYRRLKPSDRHNATAPDVSHGGGVYEAAGLQLLHPASETPAAAYTADTPAQTSAPAFQAGGEQALQEDYYGTSSVQGGLAHIVVHFGNGMQVEQYGGAPVLLRAVRYEPIED